MTLYKTVADLNGGTQVEMTAEEEAEFLAEQSFGVASQVIPDLIAKAQLALDASDVTATRCFKASQPFPSDWQAYVSSLRAIISTGNSMLQSYTSIPATLAILQTNNASIGSLPTKPSYPAGT